MRNNNISNGTPSTKDGCQKATKQATSSLQRAIAKEPQQMPEANIAHTNVATMTQPGRHFPAVHNMGLKADRQSATKLTHGDLARNPRMLAGIRVTLQDWSRTCREN
ncbi:hypothetical protein HT136_00535 [Novosphingobium profundi]|uniref:hypothetical protein n=1 Tax=Novosphingobium profundi TaxID=1774954 RepID=UPI001BDA888F|nr:hypothetical protein [Novosphingobium profundi]MBT0666854.1 hypothetical protein [Novosphingobium profundi]